MYRPSGVKAGLVYGENNAVDSMRPTPPWSKSRTSTWAAGWKWFGEPGMGVVSSTSSTTRRGDSPGTKKNWLGKRAEFDSSRESRDGTSHNLRTWPVVRSHAKI